MRTESLDRRRVSWSRPLGTAATRRLLWGLALVLLWVAAPRQAGARGARRLPNLAEPSASGVGSTAWVHVPVTLHVARDAGRPVVAEARWREWVLRANRALFRYRVQISVRMVHDLPAGYAKVKRKWHRRRLARSAPRDGSIHVFVVSELELAATHRADRSARGMHWRFHGPGGELARREYLVVTRDAPATTLAHELGHLFGLAHHTSPKNLMCSCRRGAEPGFTASQGTRVRFGARRFLRRQLP